MEVKLTFLPGLTAKFEKLLDLLMAQTTNSARPLKAIASDMDLSPSDLSRKLRHYEGDPRAFSVEDLDRWIQATGDLSPLYWLIEKHVVMARDAREELLDRLASRYEDLDDLAAIIKDLRGAALKNTRRAR
ncbi:MAG: hypothetical protein IT356_00050 [Gemmatimonadaceae bacterium]|nr:hypothetical protein [Gemmatimonadaceae bacterium]